MKAKGAAATSFVSSELESSSGSPEEEHEIKWTTAALYGGGADTVRISTNLRRRIEINGFVSLLQSCRLSSLR